MSLDQSTQSAEEALFQSGLETILAPYRARGVSQEEIQDVTSRARSFFEQQQRLQKQGQEQVTGGSSEQVPRTTTMTNEQHGTTDDASAAAAPLLTTPAPAPAPAPPQDNPPYPPSFAELARLIATGAPIPGIKHIPDQLAEGEPSKSTLAAQIGQSGGTPNQIGVKPWEKQRANTGQQQLQQVGDGQKTGTETGILDLIQTQTRDPSESRPVDVGPGSDVEQRQSGP